MFSPVARGSEGDYHCHGERGEGNKDAQHLRSLWQQANADLKQIREDEHKLKAAERHHAGERQIEGDERKELADIEKFIGALLGL